VRVTSSTFAFSDLTFSSRASASSALCKLARDSSRKSITSCLVLERISRFLVVKSWKELERVKSWTELEKLKDGVRDRDRETKVVGGDSIVSFFIARYI
jgi:hypothetical protein